jgi:integrase
MLKTITFKELSAMWIDDKKAFVKSSTISAYTLILEKHILPFFGDLSSVSEDDVQAFLIDRFQAGLAHKTVVDIIAVLKMIYKYGSRKGYLESREWVIRFPANIEKMEIEVMSRHNQKRLMNYLIENFSFRNFGLLICMTAGLRIGEICALKWEDLNTQKGLIHVRRTVERIYVIDGNERYTKLTTCRPKTTNSFRVIPMSHVLLRLARPVKRIANDDHYILTNSDIPMEPRTYRRYFTRMLEKLNIPKIRFHGLRHSFATLCIESGCNYKTVSAILGHASIKTTLDMYVHPDMDEKKRCIKKITKVLI